MNTISGITFFWDTSSDRGFHTSEGSPDIFFFFFRDPHLVSGYNRKHRMIEIKVLKGVSLVPEQIYPCGDILSQ